MVVYAFPGCRRSPLLQTSADLQSNTAVNAYSPSPSTRSQSDELPASVCRRHAAGHTRSAASTNLPWTPRGIFAWPLESGRSHTHRYLRLGCRCPRSQHTEHRTPRYGFVGHRVHIRHAASVLRGIQSVRRALVPRPFSPTSRYLLKANRVGQDPGTETRFHQAEGVRESESGPRPSSTSPSHFAHVLLYFHISNATNLTRSVCFCHLPSSHGK
ncbi:hypothetical protein FA95DRAFT_653734 [Auriscalpium vulgare]|uniref:Uncharacterized protein n=1 Tax=Auriscalpium vulgare TaxID=40419 RepID=A0ACB8RDW5_9AGAM|nr:hypothetical protein FA95DRAFT_653734 [Auriscalpium vulgare]